MTAKPFAAFLLGIAAGVTSLVLVEAIIAFWWLGQ
jgi:hypothetical protein